MMRKCTYHPLLAALMTWPMLVGVSCTAAEPPSFEEATVAPFSPEPQATITGKKIAEIKAAVKAEWPNIRFKDDAGNPITYTATIVTSKGTMVAEFYPDVAPGHVKSFICLAKAGFYDGLLFHRVIPGFMIQGGCPLGSGTGGPGYCVKQEFSTKPHLEGVLSMARAGHPDSAGSQFFVCVDKPRFLDNNYTVFGKVTTGYDVALAIANVPRNQNDRPLEAVKIEKVTIQSSAAPAAP